MSLKLPCWWGRGWNMCFIQTVMLDKQVVVRQIVYEQTRETADMIYGFNVAECLWSSEGTYGMEAGGVKTVPTEWLLRRNKYLLRSNQVWILLSILGLHKAAPGGWGWWPDPNSDWVTVPASGTIAVAGAVLKSCSDKWPSCSSRTLSHRK